MISRGIEVNSFAKIHLTLEAKFGDNPLLGVEMKTNTTENYFKN